MRLADFSTAAAPLNLEKLSQEVPHDAQEQP